MSPFYIEELKEGADSDNAELLILNRSTGNRIVLKKNETELPDLSVPEELVR